MLAPEKTPLLLSRHPWAVEIAGKVKTNLKRTGGFLAALLAAPLLLLTARAGESDALDAGAGVVEQLEEVLVTGERPGPSLWKVTGKDGNVLWILPTLGPLPDKLVWKSTQVEAIIRQSREIYTDFGSVHASIRVHSKQGKRFAQVSKLPDGKTLKDVLPPDAYAYLMKFKPKIADGKVDVETMRPMMVVDALNSAVLRKFELTSDGGIPGTVSRIARESRVRVRSLRVEDKAHADAMLSAYESTSPEVEAHCAAARLGRMGRNVALAVSRANAWAAGDIRKLRQDKGLFEQEDQSAECAPFYANLDTVPMQKAAASGYAALAGALRKNKSTLALVSVQNLFAEDGLLTKLRADGCFVEDPDSMPGIAGNARSF